MKLKLNKLTLRNLTATLDAESLKQVVGGNTFTIDMMSAGSNCCRAPAAR